MAESSIIDLKQLKPYGKSRTGLYLPGRILEKERLPTCIDFFCGCGGFSLGVTQAGFHVVAAVDNDIGCCVTYLVNLGAYPVQLHFTDEEEETRLNNYIQRLSKNGELPLSGSGWISNYPEVPGVEHYWLGDVRKLQGQEILDALGMEPGEVDLCVGGPPCQGFSIAGKREVMDTRNSLVFDYARLLCEIRPKAFMMENVPGMLSMVTPEGISVVDALCRIMSDGGFGTYNSIKRMIQATAGCGVALKGSNAPKASEPEEDAEGKEPVMASLF
jgi:DNA (cytosine-5)-methyltransferase 1